MATGVDRKASEPRRGLAARVARCAPFRPPPRRLLAVAAAALAAASLPLCADPDGRADWKLPGAEEVAASHALPVEPASGAVHERGAMRTDAPTADAPYVNSSSVNAPPVLGAIGRQRLVAGRPWQLHVRARDPDGDAPVLRVHELPESAALSDEGNGWHRLDWTPPKGMRGRIDLTIVAVDARDADLRRERVVRLEVSGPARPSGAGSITAPAPVPPEPLAPVIAPLSSWIVSAGRTVLFRVAATLEGSARSPDLQIDRLPDGASFYANDDGTRTFHWPTDDGDQGEHRFRVTALHPDDDTLESGVDLLVVVGDPTRARTAPIDETGTASAPSSVSPPADGSPALAPSATAPFGNDVRGPLENERFLPQAELGESDYWDDGSGDPDDRSVAATDPRGDGAPSSIGADGRHAAPAGGGYFDEGGGVPLGPDGQPLGPDAPPF